MSRATAALLLGLAPVAYGLAALALPMDANWDLRNYHYYNAYAWLTGREGYDLLVAQLPSFFNPLIDVPFYLAVGHWPARLVGFLLGTVQGLNVLPLYGIALAALRIEPPRRRRLVAAALALLGLLGVGAISELGTTFYDNVVSLGPLAALWLILDGFDGLRSGEPRSAAARLLAAGFLAGIAVGLKQPIVSLGAGAGLALLVVPTGWPARLGSVALFGTGALLGVLASDGFWMLHLWRSYGNPLFPFFNGLFRSPWALPYDYRDVFYIPKNLWIRLFFPFAYLADPSLTAELEFRDIRVLACFVLIPLAGVTALWRRIRSRPAEDAFASPAISAYLLAAFAIGYVVWVTIFCIYRYLVAFEMLAPLIIVLAIGILPLSRRTAGFAATSVILLTVVTVEPANWGRVPWSRRWITATTPEIADPARTLVLITGHEPLAYLVPFFPPAMRFLRIHSGFTAPFEPQVRFNLEMHRIVARHPGPIDVLYNPNEARFADEHLAAYGLRIDRQACRLVTSNIGYVPSLLCAVER